MFDNSMLFVGLDLGDRYSHVAVLDQEGALLEEVRLPTTQDAFRRKFSGLPASRIAMEVGAHSRWVSQLLRELGHEAPVANARKLRAIHDNPRKGDRADAQTLARLARLDPALLSPIHHRSPQALADLAILRSRDALVRSRSLLINHVRGTAKAAGARLPSCTSHGFAAKVAPAIPDALQAALFPILDSIAALDQHIRDYDRHIDGLCRDRYPETLALRRVADVGPVTALAFILTLEDPTRFRKSRQTDLPSAWSPSATNPATATLSFVSPRPATPICGASWSAAPNTSSAPSAPTVTCAAGVYASRQDIGAMWLSAEARAPGREPWWLWLGSWPSCSIACGSPGRSTNRLIHQPS
jgi:transposase